MECIHDRGINTQENKAENKNTIHPFYAAVSVCIVYNFIFFDSFSLLFGVFSEGKMMKKCIKSFMLISFSLYIMLYTQNFNFLTSSSRWKFVIFSFSYFPFPLSSSCLTFSAPARSHSHSPRFIKNSNLFYGWKAEIYWVQK